MKNKIVFLGFKDGYKKKEPPDHFDHIISGPPNH